MTMLSDAECAQIHDAASHVLASTGMDVSDELLAVPLIERLAANDASFLSDDEALGHAVRHFRKELFLPELMDRRSVAAWLDEAEHGPLFYLVGDFQGNSGSIRIAGLPKERAEDLERAVRYAARVKDNSCWTAEWKIPLASVCLAPVRTEACCFDIGVGKPGTAIDKSWPSSKRVVAGWAVWAGTGIGGTNWEV